MTLFINACVREASRTKELADHLLSRQNCTYEEVRLDAIEFPIVNQSFLEKRDRLIFDGDFSNPLFDLARQFAAADDIVIAAPFWDLSFPAALKQYFEQINVVGITFVYTHEGMPAGLCKARCLTYITTAGGNFFPEEYGSGYVKSLAQNFYGIPQFKLIKVIGLDIDGTNIDSIMNSAKADIEMTILQSAPDIR
jgi:FMN-dependent NADH-azoreductase